MVYSKLILGDCLEKMKDIPDRSVDMVLCDLPYGITACKWDTVIPFEPLWEQYKRIIKPRCGIVLTSAQPFTSSLIMSNPNWFKHHWVWIKERGTGFQVAKYRPLMKTEDIIMFSSKSPKYNPQMTLRDKPHKYKYPKIKSHSNPIANYNEKEVISTHRYPNNTLTFNTERGLHPTQKPVPLFEYLIKTYTDEGDLVLDNCMGCGTTAIACLNTKRNFIGIELDEHYLQVAKDRLEKHSV